MTFSSPIAQTNVQLYRQLVCGGYTQADMGRVNDAYELATELFSGQYRGCGKTLIAHLVGVASVQVSLDMSVEQIQAGLLHSVYRFGDFGGLPSGFHEKKRDRLLAVISEEAESLVHAFHDLRWEEEDIKRTANTDPSGYNEQERTLLLIRLAHEIDEHSDWTFLFTSKYNRPEVLRRLSMIATIAEGLGRLSLAEYARQLAADVQQADVGLDTGSEKPGVYAVVPESYRLRFTAWRIYQMARRYVTQWTGLAPRGLGAAD